VQLLKLQIWYTTWVC